MLMAKNKNNKTVDAISDIATSTGVLLMTAATTLGLIDMPNQPDKRVVLNVKPVFAEVGEIGQPELPGSQLRREREETGPHYISYSVAQRTPGRSGKY
jgi:hypothetical protein